VLEICQQAEAKTVAKGKSMISEELGINEHLEKNGITAVETLRCLFPRVERDRSSACETLSFGNW
jgi:hypothetical protein